LYNEFQFMLNPDGDSENEDEEMVEGDEDDIQKII
jgi:hypothetical protein